MKEYSALTEEELLVALEMAQGGSMVARVAVAPGDWPVSFVRATEEAVRRETAKRVSVEEFTALTVQP